MQTITKDTVVVGTPPRISPAKFAQVLKDARSPAAATDEMIENAFAYVVGVGVDPCFILAVYRNESQFGTDPDSMTVKYDLKNVGNCRSSSIGPRPTQPTEKGNFVRYRDYPEAFLDAANRLVDLSFPYAQEGRKTIEQVIERWAPSSENDTQRYIDNVVQFMSEWIDQDGSSNTMQDPTTQVHLIPGHVGRGRGGVHPQLIVCHVQEGTNDLYSEFLNRQPGKEADCTIWSKQDGSLIRLLNDGDTPWTNGDVVAPDMSNPVIASLIHQGVTNTNSYSYTVEHQGYAAKGFTDAQIEATAKMCTYWMDKEGWGPGEVGTRIVGHFQVGNHKNCPGPLFPWTKLRARVVELLGNGGIDKVTNQSNGTTPRPPAAPVTKLNNRIIGGGFRAFYEKLAAVSPNFELLVLGLPLTNEFDCDLNGDNKPNTVQLYERGALVYEAANFSPWDVHLTTIRQLELILAAAKNKALIV